MTHRHPINADGTCNACSAIAERLMMDDAVAADAWTSSRRGTWADKGSRIGRPYYCEPCGRIHDDTDDDRAACLGVRGVRLGRAYVRHACGTHDAGTYLVVNAQRTHPINTERDRGRTVSVSFPPASLGYCEACGVVRRDHVNDGHAYRAAMVTYAHDAHVRATGITHAGARGRGGAILRAIVRDRVNAYARDYHAGMSAIV